LLKADLGLNWTLSLTFPFCQ